MRSLCCALMFALSAFAAVGRAGTIVYGITAANGATAEADFTFGASQLTVVLKNTSVNPANVAWNLSAFEFVFAGGAGGALTNASSPESRTVNGDKTYTDAGSVSGAGSVGWAFMNTAPAYILDVLSGPGHAGPANTIIGAPAGDNKYDAANPSIAGNGPHNPYLATSATFDFTFTSGVNAITRPWQVLFQFGTIDNTFVPGIDVTPGPEPGTFAMLGIGAVAVLVFRKRLTGRRG